MNLAQYQKLDIPKKPGVYFFKQDDTVLYIGKATNLKHRTGSYLQKNLMETRGPLIVKMVEDADTLEWQETESALEALILESHLIKKHQPHYNTREKDNKSYNYVVIADEKPARVFMVRKRQLDILQGSENKKLKKVFGPFPQGALLQEALKIIRKIFPFYGKKTHNTNVEEFYRQLSLLPGKNTEDDQYARNIEYISMLFSGKKRGIITELKKQMKNHADKLEFEQADRIKKQIFALEHIRDIALLKHEFELGTDHSSIRMEAYDVAHLHGDAMKGVMVVYDGKEINSSLHRVFNIQSTDHADDTKALEETLSRRLSHPEWPYPELIIVDGGIAQKRVMEKVLRNHQIKIPVVSVVKDNRHKAKGVLGQKTITEKYTKEILALNAESHRFALKNHSQRARKDFLG
jgi:excinuclease ABC subunit C